MLKNIDEKLLALDGNVILDNGKEISIKDILIDALMDNSAESNSITGDQKLDRYLLAIKCKQGGEIDFTPEQIVTFKKLIGVKYPPLVVGQLFLFFNS